MRTQKMMRLLSGLSLVAGGLMLALTAGVSPTHPPQNTISRTGIMISLWLLISAINKIGILVTRTTSPPLALAAMLAWVMVFSLLISTSRHTTDEIGVFTLIVTSLVFFGWPMVDWLSLISLTNSAKSDEI